MKPELSDRRYWLETALRIVDPVWHALAERRLKETMPVEGPLEDRPLYTHLEVIARSLTGLAPWLEVKGLSGEEEDQREYYADLARRSIDAATDPESPDFMNFSRGMQPIVDTAFLAHAFVRAPENLWGRLPERVKRNTVAAMKSTRTRKPGFNNWLLFSGMIENFLYRAGESDWDRMRIDFALKQHEQWYKGDGLNGDGPDFCFDYYNSFVIHPMMLDILAHAGGEDEGWVRMREPVLRRARRYAEILERLISPEGAFPAVGRSLAYRFGAFHLLSQMALKESLPETLSPAQVRCALTAVIRRMMDMPGTFDERGWLKIGFCGHQPEAGEAYISTGSLYLCCAVFLPLGLAPGNPFWSGPAESWTSQKAWGGLDFPRDKALHDG